MAQLIKNPPVMQETCVRSLGWEDPWRREWLPTPVFWPGEFHGLYGPWGCKELDMTERLSLSFYSSMSLNFKYMNCSFNIYFNVFANFDSCVCSSSVLAD